MENLNVWSMAWQPLHLLDFSTHAYWKPMQNDSKC